MEYKDTLNLPKTSFKMKANLSQKEPEILRNLEEQDIYQKIRDKYKGKPSYILHDGPPYANGDIHVGQAFNKIMKDMVIKYKTMKGFDVPYVPGWDCHGLPIEYQLFKELGVSRHQIDQVKFRKKARAYANKYIERQKKEFKRLGIFGEWDNPYLTMNFNYEAKIIRAFGKLAKDGYIYKGKKPVYWCIKCETALAEAEVEYAEKTSPSVWVKFPVKDKSATYILIWTTTPWTIPANVAVAVHPEFKYAFVKTRINGAEQVLVMAESRVSAVAEICFTEKYEILKVVKGEDLGSMEYRHPFLDRIGKVVFADYVEMDDGTGCVHTAPGHGADDYLTGIKFNLPILSPVNNKGEFTEEAGSDIKGQNVFEANAKIIDKLSSESLLLHEDKVQHSYPHCWRCREPVIFRATPQWFMSVDKHNLRDRALAAVKKAEWIPPRTMNRIDAMLTNRPDWCLSRQRYWGVAIPVLYCADCEHTILDQTIIENTAKLVSARGSDAWFEVDIAEIIPENFACPKCGKTSFEKEKDIIDVWFDSGVSHEAVLKKRENLSWPADLYLEGSDQHRGWFQTSLLTSMGLNNKSCYRSVLTHGFVVDAEGKKMSKSVGNVIDPQDVTAKYGADILRLWVCSSDYKDDIRISDDILRQIVDAYRRIRNTVRFILGNISDFNPDKDRIAHNKLTEIDKWMYSKLQELIKNIGDAYEKFAFSKVYILLGNFCANELSSFYLDVLKDRLYTAKKDSFQRRSSQTVLYEIIEKITRLMCPVLAFTSEEIWKHIHGKEESVFLADFPSAGKIDNSLHQKWQKILNIREKVLKIIEEAREEKLIGNSLEAEVTIHCAKETVEFLKSFEETLSLIFIVSKVNIAQFPKADSKDELKVVVKRASGEKCVRCWNWSESVGKNKQHPELCDRCVEVMKSTEVEG
ncbi:isoleucine--tRNA ligase [bacterium]|nr:isoleucine--tRNA ligase [bacterium]